MLSLKLLEALVYVSFILFILLFQGQSNNGFMPVNLVVPPSSNASPVQLSNSTATPVSAVAPIRSVPPLPLQIAQPLKPIQPVQPQMQPRVQVLPSPTNGAVSYTHLRAHET